MNLPGNLSPTSPSPELAVITADEVIPGFIICSPKMRQVGSLIAKYAKTDSLVLVTGETGTGKELVARAIHEFSPRRRSKFIPIDCANLDKETFQSELFGHVKGAFTDAFRDRAGLLEIADNGTVFIDEVSRLSLDLQTRFLRVLESNVIKRLGDNKFETLNVRYVVATNDNLLTLVENNVFREDLYYRLDVLTLYIPPLRERVEDILPLVYYYLDYFSKLFKLSMPIVLTPQTQDQLRSYSWPGNIRQLKHVIEKVVAVADDDNYVITDITLSQENVHNNSSGISSGITLNLFESGSLKEIMMRTERELIANALMITRGDITKAAKLLQLKRPTVRDKIQRLGIR